MSGLCFQAALATYPARTAWKAANTVTEQRMALTCSLQAEAAFALPSWGMVSLCAQQTPVWHYCTDRSHCSGIMMMTMCPQTKDDELTTVACATM